jgi:hypothetical protein
MSLHALLKDTWYMKLRAKREAIQVAPSEFALRVPTIDKRNDNLLKQGHHNVTPSNTLHTYSQTNGDYIKQHTHNHAVHTVSNFTPKFLALLKKSSPADNTGYDDEPPVEGGAEGEAKEASVGSGEGAEGGAEGAESAEGEDLEIDLKTPPTAEGGKSISAGSPLVWKPVGEAYDKLNLGIELHAERQGASMIVMGKALNEYGGADADVLPELKEILQKLSTLQERATGVFAKRIKDDRAKIVKTVNRIKAQSGTESVASSKKGAGGGIGGAVAVAKEVLGKKVTAGAVAHAVHLAGGGGKPASPEEEGWEYPKKKGKGKGK